MPLLGHLKLEHIRWRTIAIPHAFEDISQGHQFDPRVKIFNVSWSTAHPL